MPSDKKIREKAHILEKKIQYKFKNITLLSTAMNSTKMSKEEFSSDNYINEKLATLGDSVLDLMVTKYIFDKFETKGDLTNERIKYTNNDYLYSVDDKEEYYKFGYNELHFADEENIPDNEKVVFNEHDVYIESIIGAVFLDSNFDKTYQWFTKYLFPILNKYLVEYQMLKDNNKKVD